MANFVDRIEEYAGRVLEPAALETDRTAVPAQTIDDLAQLGALNHLAPAEYGGAGLGTADDRRVHEIIAGACFNTWLVWAQHAPLVGRLAASPTPSTGALAERVLRGRILLGAGISDVRRFPEHYIAATRTPKGWVFDGTISWVSGWGLNEALTVSAVEASTNTVVTALVPVSSRTRGEPLRLGAVTGSRTERVRLDAIDVPEEDVLGTQDLDAWRRADIGTASDARPHHFGLALRVLKELKSASDPQARAVAASWIPRIARLRADAYSLADEAAAAGGGSYRIDERLALKVASGEALGTLTRALLAARSGHGISGDDTAQLHARNALFVLVQGQSAAVRSAQLSFYSSLGDPS
ncbi:alkylation response protein AidB-like acyl-CoA dehydrogenase [Actinoplanes lutulentus]|uniref:Alkylation response protein AidB-like acyl-CoA dehydrogenase n=1 Tax=Actinoplanes lutulentus TaxID=1287878 RepID=A0A327ZLC7_9ACTN|nr:acyl-CoA dehydrogenase family protein [Actinoplanes lutulentus]MBB2940931.1 alkylation response protein AidB-like acyl-CoA dehydrogenase [Actinoplanes lutulentus]RAK43240.1 alkylation response protein AidB-like acyl-CoA dehydrogenase [Actinoplanes lutulentus]